MFLPGHITVDKTFGLGHPGLSVVIVIIVKLSTAVTSFAVITADLVVN